MRLLVTLNKTHIDCLQMVKTANRNLDASHHRVMIYRMIISNRTADHCKVLLDSMPRVRVVVCYTCDRISDARKENCILRLVEVWVKYDEQQLRMRATCALHNTDSVWSVINIMVFPVPYIHVCYLDLSDKIKSFIFRSLMAVKETCLTAVN